ncbi:DUF5916 domain-containing protein [Yeosuana sp. MJ-SS3]|uniref:DUF5916 domain-containing protein n=1 Tax=Gilvirhabdus luticola TaxID=3079858 RepID=A0ABU3UA72_9FLAO|nr:DUF5916 domain-containing protein [Yeosuana sp. MJ-SS3]MDU8887286.1 DUF5916 domain-containing protein [Yeosuana sp. MJ-SS3]
MKRFSCVIFILFFLANSTAQEKKVLNIKKTEIPPKIDGVLDDDAWENAQIGNDFVQFRPDMGIAERPHQKSQIQMTYNDDAVFIAAYLHDNPKEIRQQFTSRDNFGQSDFFAVIVNPNNDGQNDTEFFVFSTGAQADAVVSSSSNEDFGWNAVWVSAVKIVDDGWIVEIKIPYSALRFSNKEVQTWGINFHRHFRKTREQYSWNPIDPTTGYGGLYHGEITGIENIEPPTRLSLYPYSSAHFETYDGETTDEFNLGLDLKYGISENFTLDATLIPDFSQAGFDDVELNLGPFEQQFEEQRQFFKEGVDLFNKGNLFYSRRIGNNPVNYDNVVDTLGENEEITNPDDKIKTINAIKVSGRSKNGLGIGILNAITEESFAKITDTITGEKRKVIVEPLANYSVLVLDQQFNKNSSVSLVNTNVSREGHYRDANVTGLLTRLNNNKNTYGIEAEVKGSFLNLQEGNKNGYSSRFEIGKISGNYQYSIIHRLADDKYDINDLGIQFRNNYNDIHTRFSYRIFKPTEKFNNQTFSAWANYHRLFNPSTYTGNDIGFSYWVFTKKIFAYGFEFNTQIGKQYDYFESREENKPFIYKNWFNGEAWFSSNYDKIFALDGRIGLGTLFDRDRDYFGYNIRVSPRIRLNDRSLIVYSIDYQTRNGSRGYVTKVGEDIIFGQRYREIITNSISGSYNFTTKHAVFLTFRNYWSAVTYDHDLFVLQDDGTLSIGDGYTVENIDNPNQNFNIWNLDLKYSWEFAPGSQLIALYRNQLTNNTNASQDNYIESLNSLFKEPIQHIFSLRFIYYIDYNNVKKAFKKKVS